MGSGSNSRLRLVARSIHAGEQSYRLCPRAWFADYTVRWLLDAMLEYTTIPALSEG